MIVASTPGHLRLVTQNDHAHFAAELLSLWRRRPFPEHPRRDSLLLAVREHDNGWWEADSAPRCRADGQPHDFRSMPDHLRRELWQRGVARFADRDPWVAALIYEHALVLHCEEGVAEPWRQLLASWREQRDVLLERCEETAKTLSEDYRFLDLCDLASLMVCCPWRQPLQRHGFVLELADEEPEGVDGVLTLEPFPLTGATTFRIPSRVIPNRGYDGDGDLAIELASARWGELVVRVAPRR